jgi:8-oxo-dGTP diphosphatase
LERKIDRRNFSRKLIALNLLLNTGEKDKDSSKRGALLHTFNAEVYTELLEKGLKLEM